MLMRPSGRGGNRGESNHCRGDGGGEIEMWRWRSWTVVMEESNARRFYGIWGGIALPTDEAMLAEIPGESWRSRIRPEVFGHSILVFWVILVYGYLIGRQ